MKYLDKKTQQICTLIENPNEITKTLQYEDGHEKIVSPATFKRWYKKFTDDVPQDDSSTEVVVPEVVQPVEVPIEISEPAVPDTAKATKKARKEQKLPVPEIAPIDKVVEVCERHNFTFKRSKDGVAIFDAEENRLLDIWKRKYEVRCYISVKLADIALDESLLSKIETLNGTIAKRYPKSVYIPYDNIEAVLTALIS